MPHEIERKFLVDADAWRDWLAANPAATDGGVAYQQGYIPTTRQAVASTSAGEGAAPDKQPSHQTSHQTDLPPATVRVRVAGERGYLTIKGPPAGITRAEYEYAIPLPDAEAMLDTLCGDRIRKTRYTFHAPAKSLSPTDGVEYAGVVEWVVDVFADQNAPLILAEVELEHADQPFTRPPFLLEEVSQDKRYTNASLAMKPFSTWGGG